MTPREGRTAPWTWFRVFCASLVTFGLMGVLWALATPVFAAPDENAHALKAVALVRGQLVGDSAEGIRHPVVELPEGYRYSPGVVCFAYRPDVSASCGVELGSDDGTPWFDTWVSSYNPVYYAAIGWPSLFLDGSTGVYGMRIASVILSSIVLAIGTAAAFAGRQAAWLPAAVCFLGAPMVAFLAGSVSPQSLEVVAAATLAITLTRLLEQHGEPRSVEAPRWFLWTGVVVSASFLALARALGPVWVVAIIGACLLVADRSQVWELFRRRSSYGWIGVIAALGSFSLGWTLWSGTLDGQAAEGDVPLVGGGFLAGAWAMIRNTPRYLLEAAGVFGWLDTPLPAIAYCVFAGAVTLLVVLAATGTDRRGSFTTGATVLSVLLLPVLIQAASVSRTGIIWQGRYALGIYLAALLITAHILSTRGTRVVQLSVRVTAVIAAMMAVFHVIAFVVVLRRYVVGTDDVVTSMISAPEWQPPLGWVLLTVMLAFAVAAFTAMVLYFSRQLSERLEST